MGVINVEGVAKEPRMAGVFPWVLSLQGRDGSNALGYVSTTRGLYSKATNRARKVVHGTGWSTMKARSPGILQLSWTMLLVVLSCCI